MGRKFAGSVQKLKDKVQNQKRQLAAMHESASEDAGGDAMDPNSCSDGEQCKHSTLTHHGKVPHKDCNRSHDGP